MTTIPDAVLRQHIAVLGKTGSGKTSTAKLIAEKIAGDGGRVCVLDPIKSDWWGMTSSQDGKKAGFPFQILGGPKGHVALHPHAGAAIGEIVANGQLALSILDMAHFEMGGLQRFFIDFAPSLLRHMRGVLYLVIEEAHEFAPKERAGFGNESMMIHFAKKLATAGRSKGIRLVIATQRTQALHNAVLGSCETMIAHRLTAPADQDPVAKWLHGNFSKERAKAVESTLSSLRTGEAWICSGEANLCEKRQFPRITTYDNSATPTEESRDIKVTTAPVDVEKLRSIVGEAVAEAKANDPTELKRRIAELESKLRGVAPVAPAAPAEVREVKVPDREQIAVLVDRCHLTCLEIVKVEERMEETTRRVVALRGEIELAAREIKSQMAVMDARAVIVPQVRQMQMRSLPVEVKQGSHQIIDGSITEPQQRILDVVCMLERRGLTPNRDMIARWLDLHPNGGSYNQNLAALRGANKLNGCSPGPALLRESVRGLPAGIEGALIPLDGSQRRIVDVLAGSGETRFSRDHLAAALDLHPNGGSFNQNLGRLRCMGLIPERGEIYLTPAAFR